MTVLCGKSGLPKRLCSHCKTDDIRSLMATIRPPVIDVTCRSEPAIRRREQRGTVHVHERGRATGSNLTCRLCSRVVALGEEIGMALLHLKTGKRARIGRVCVRCVRVLVRRGTVVKHPAGA